MGAILSYSLVTSVLLAVLYLMYKWLFAGEKQARYNRVMLWAIYIVAFAAVPAADAVSALTATAPTQHGGIEIGVITATIADSAESSSPGLTWLAVVYLAGAAAALLLTAITAVRLTRLICRGRHIRCNGYTVVLTDTPTVSPFSWGRYMVMGEADYCGGHSLIALHERAHIERHHWLDLLAGQLVAIFQWYNPAAWLMREELKALHEYQADDAVLRSGADARAYQMLLIKKAVGARFPSLANSLNHSKLKKRITMMYKSKSSGEQRLKALALMPALGLALMAAALPQAKAAISTIDNSRMLPDKVTNFSSDVKDCAEKPGFMLQVNGEYSITDSVIKAENPISIVIPKDNPDIKNAPKYYIDGKEVSESELNSIKPEDIERISVFRNPDRTCVTLKEEDSFENSHILTPDGKHNSPEITIMVDGKKISKKELKAIKCENIDSISIDKTKDIIYFTLKKTTEK